MDRDKDKSMDMMNEIPVPKKKEAVKLVQAHVPLSLYKQVDSLRKSANPKSPVTMREIIEWGLREWELKVGGDKKR